MFLPEAQQKGLTLKTVPSSAITSVRVIDLVRIVSNLTANAIRYTNSGGVIVGVRRRSGGFALEVWDTGPGIPADQLDTVLQPCERGATAKNTKGEGLGLSIARELADRNGLTLSIRSEIGRGTVFTIGGLPKL